MGRTKLSIFMWKGRFQQETSGLVQRYGESISFDWRLYKYDIMGSMAQAEAALRVAQAAYRFGERGILDVLDAQRVLRSVRADLLLARYQLQASLIELDALAGRYSRKAN